MVLATYRMQTSNTILLYRHSPYEQTAKHARMHTRAHRELTDPVIYSFFRIIFLHWLHFCRINECICFHNDMAERKWLFMLEQELIVPVDFAP